MAMELRYECPWCDKSFSCGKGLGGHKRVHRYKERDDLNQNQIIPLLQPIQISDKTTCPVCQKSFSSEKSLHGHMRKHPDRSWRGMRPPPLPALPPPPPNQFDSVYVAHNLVSLTNPQFRFACDVCGKQFDSYQALGGHKSHHGLNARRVDMEQPFDHAGKASDGGKQSPLLMLTIDLNELPPEAHED